MAASIAMGLQAVSTVSSLHEGRMAGKKAEGIANQEAKDLAIAEKKAKAKRAEGIKSQRAQMGIGGSGFSPVASAGGMLAQGETLG